MTGADDLTVKVRAEKALQQVPIPTVWNGVGLSSLNSGLEHVKTNAHGPNFTPQQSCRQNNAYIKAVTVKNIHMLMFIEQLYST